MYSFHSHNIAAMGKYNVIAKLHTFNVLEKNFYENFINRIKTQKIFSSNSLIYILRFEM